jgi:PAS domain S-box-containing protein
LTEEDPIPGLPGADAGDVLQAVVSSSDEAIFTKTLDGTITSWNPAAERLYGYSAEEAVGQNVRMLAPGQAEIDEINEIMEMVAAGEQIDHRITNRKGKSGRVIEVAITVTPMTDAEGKIVGAVTVTEPGMLAKRIHDLKGQVAALATAVRTLSGQIDDFVTGPALDDRVRKLGRRFVALVLIVFLVGAVGVFKFRSDGCHRRNESNQVIRKIVDRSTTNGGGVDVSKLTPDEQRFLADLVAAQPAQGSPQSFHNFVYNQTKPQNCSLF